MGRFPETCNDPKCSCHDPWANLTQDLLPAERLMTCLARSIYSQTPDVLNVEAINIAINNLYSINH